VGAEEQHRASLGAREGASDGCGVRTDDPVLKLRGLRRIDPDVRERAEPGRDPVDDLAGRDGVLDHATGGGDTLPRSRPEDHVGPRRDRRHVRKRERLPDRDRHGCEGYYRTRTFLIRSQRLCFSIPISDTSGPVSCIT
jgi:hypothetical protein